MLVDRTIKAAQAQKRPYRLHDTQGLYLLPRPAKIGTRSLWRYADIVAYANSIVDDAQREA